MMKKLIVRRGCDSDRQGLQALLASHQMDTNIDPVEFWAAEVDGFLAGAARLESEDGLVYLRPIVVDRRWQAKGIGRALITELITDLPKLNVIARGEAVGFYVQMGFVPLAWGEVPDRFCQECADCYDLEICQPKPMTWQQSQVPS